jgi:hypothetical protein
MQVIAMINLLNFSLKSLSSMILSIECINSLHENNETLLASKTSDPFELSGPQNFIVRLPRTCTVGIVYRKFYNKSTIHISHNDHI